MAQVVKEAESYLEQFMKLPDWNRYPMPETFYKTFGIEKPKALEISAYLRTNLESFMQAGFGSGQVEIRGPAEGGVRKIDLAPLEIADTELIPDEKADDKASVSEAERPSGQETNGDVQDGERKD
jgi:hypothetical protein